MADGRLRRECRHVLAAVVRRRCPRCGQGAAFASWLVLRPGCAVCDRRFQRDPGACVGLIQFASMATLIVSSLASVALYFAMKWLLEATIPITTVFTVAFGCWVFSYAKLSWEVVDFLIDVSNGDDDRPDRLARSAFPAHTPSPPADAKD